MIWEESFAAEVVPVVPEGEGVAAGVPLGVGIGLPDMGLPEDVGMGLPGGLPEGVGIGLKVGGGVPLGVGMGLPPWSERVACLAVPAVSHAAAAFAVEVPESPP